jgi:hypothetical protein
MFRTCCRIVRNGSVRCKKSLTRKNISSLVVNYVRNPYSTNANESIKDTPYLSSEITNMIFAKVNEDATLLFHDIFSVEEKSVVKG